MALQVSQWHAHANRYRDVPSGGRYTTPCLRMDMGGRALPPCAVVGTRRHRSRVCVLSSCLLAWRPFDTSLLSDLSESSSQRNAAASHVRSCPRHVFCSAGTAVPSSALWPQRPFDPAAGGCALAVRLCSEYVRYQQVGPRARAAWRRRGAARGGQSRSTRIADPDEQGHITQRKKCSRSAEA
jgi:hypothetical protein